jgi:hypothetical protein
MVNAITVFMMSAKPVSYIPKSPCLLNLLREVLGYKDYSLPIEKVCRNWRKFFALLQHSNGKMRGHF